MRMQTKYTRAQCAAEYLKHVAARTGANEDGDGACHLTAGGTHFLVDAKFVRVTFPRFESTCFSVAADLDMPSAEVVMMLDAISVPLDQFVAMASVVPEIVFPDIVPLPPKLKMPIELAESP